MFIRKGLVLFVALALGSGLSQAEIPTDFHIQSDRLDVDGDSVGGMDRYNQRYIEALLERQYPVPAIMLHAVARGMAISDVVYLMTRTQPERGAEFYNQAVELLPSLPGNVCVNQSGMDYRYTKAFNPDQLEPNAKVRDVANRYFENAERATPFPDWMGGNQGHMNAQVTELLQLSQEEDERQREQGRGGENTWWYQPSDLPIDGNKPLFVSLYPKDKRIIIDADTQTLTNLKGRGVNQVPVVLVYNRSDYVPTSDIDTRAGGTTNDNQDEENYIDYGDEEITASEVLDRYFSSGVKVTPPREWQQVDHHLMVETPELDKLFELPTQEEIGAERWNQISQKLQSQGFEKPVLITLRRDSGNRWADDLDWVAVAMSQGRERIPVVFFYSEANRWPCGVPAACGDTVYEAAQRAGADPKTLPRKPPIRPVQYGAPGQGKGSRSPN